MADIELVIRVDEEDYKRLREYEKAPFNSLTSRVYEAIANGTPLPKGHGKLIDADAVDVSQTIGGMNDFADCIREAVQTTLDNALTIIEADKESEDKE